MWSKKSKYSWPKAYGEIKNYHDEAFRAIDQAITLEEREKPKEVSKNRYVCISNHDNVSFIGN